MGGCRFSRETAYEKTTSFFFILTIVSWTHTRIYVFFREIIGGVLLIMLDLGRHLHDHYFVHCFFPPALLLLAVLNIFWAFQMIRVVFWRFFKGRAELPFEDAKDKRKA